MDPTDLKDGLFVLAGQSGLETGWEKRWIFGVGAAFKKRALFCREGLIPVDRGTGLVSGLMCVLGAYPYGANCTHLEEESEHFTREPPSVNAALAMKSTAELSQQLLWTHFREGREDCFHHRAPEHLIGSVRWRLQNPYLSR